MDDATKELLAHGSSLIELLKQPLYKPMPLYKQVILLIIANNKILIDIPIKEIGKFKDGVIEYIENTRPEIIKEIMDKRVYSDEIGAEVVKIAKEYKESR